MTMPKGLTPEQRKEWYAERWRKEKAHMIETGIYDEYRNQCKERYRRSTPEQKKRHLENNRRWLRAHRTDPNFIEICHRRSREWAMKRSKCYGCEFWKFVPTPTGCAGGAFHYCKKYPQATTPWKRKHACDKLKQLCQAK